MRVTAAPALAAVAVAGLLAGCAPTASPAAGPGDATRAQQEALSERALASLAGRACPSLPAGPRLQGLPDEKLACLGAGARRAPSQGDGRPTVVNLWASWCAPCVREMPMLQQTAQQAGERVRFVGVLTQDARDSAAALLEETGVTSPSYDDPDAIVRAKLRVTGLPVTLVFDRTGQEVARKFGEADSAWLRTALAEAGAPLDDAG